MVNATLSKLTYTSAFFCSVSTTKFVNMHMCDMFYNIMGWNMLCMLTILYTCILARKKWAQNANCKWCNKACGGVLHLSVITKNICLFALLVCASMFFFPYACFMMGFFVCVFSEYMWPHYRIFANICTICFHQEVLWYAWKLV